MIISTKWLALVVKWRNIKPRISQRINSRQISRTFVSIRRIAIHPCVLYFSVFVSFSLLLLFACMLCIYFFIRCNSWWTNKINSQTCGQGRRSGVAVKSLATYKWLTDATSQDLRRHRRPEQWSIISISNAASLRPTLTYRHIGALKVLRSNQFCMSLSLGIVSSVYYKCQHARRSLSTVGGTHSGQSTPTTVLLSFTFILPPPGTV